MTETDFIERWFRERPIYEAWGNYVADRVAERVREQIAPMAIDIFLRLPPKSRVKTDTSLVDKAFYRNKNYANPYDDITDKVGVRFVVLLTSDIPVVERAVTTCPEWDHSKDRDYEREQAENPIQFDYAAVHFVVRCSADLSLKEATIPQGTPCEIQIKTILQHAHSEVAHDSIYKPKVVATPVMRRAAAKSMALIEATNDYFEQVLKQVTDLVAPARALTESMSKIYREKIREPDVSRTEALLLDAYEDVLGDDIVDRVSAFLNEKAFVPEQIAARATQKLLYRQPAILLVYLRVNEAPAATKSKWPLTDEELKPIFVDLGKAFDNY